ncbi:ABC transporter permease [Candidatus Cloacimonadota bacterium]
MIWKLAIRNIFGAGLRTWLNVFVLSLVYFTIIALQGLYDGWQQDTYTQIKKWDIGGGQYWQKEYDPLDPFSFDDSHGLIPQELVDMISRKEAVPILLSPAAAYPEGRMRNILLKGIPHDQELLEIPTHLFETDNEGLEALIGMRTADALDLKEGDYITIRWRDNNGTFDANEVEIIGVFNTTVVSVDANQLWLPLKRLQDMLLMNNEATIITIANEHFSPVLPGWERKDLSFLLRDLDSMIEAKKTGSSIMYILIMFMAMIAIFDTQILAIFRRRKEMGTLMALGLTRIRLIKLFTLEGILHAVLAIGVGAIYGIPLLRYFEKVGYQFNFEGGDFGISGISDGIYPEYGWRLVVGTIILVLVITTIVSFLPTRKISKLKPTDALKGKFTVTGRKK